MVMLNEARITQGMSPISVLLTNVHLLPCLDQFLDVGSQPSIVSALHCVDLA